MPIIKVKNLKIPYNIPLYVTDENGNVIDTNTILNLGELNIQVDNNGSPIVANKSNYYKTLPEVQVTAKGYNPFSDSEEALSKADLRMIDKRKADEEVHEGYGPKLVAKVGGWMTLGALGATGLATAAPIVAPYVGSTLSTAGELLTPSTYLNSLFTATGTQMPAWLGLAADLGTSSYFAYNAGKDISLNGLTPSNAIQAGLSVIPGVGSKVKIGNVGNELKLGLNYFTKPREVIVPVNKSKPLLSLNEDINFVSKPKEFKYPKSNVLLIDDLDKPSFSFLDEFNLKKFRNKFDIDDSDLKSIKLNGILFSIMPESPFMLEEGRTFVILGKMPYNDKTFFIRTDNIEDGLTKGVNFFSGKNTGNDMTYFNFNYDYTGRNLIPTQEDFVKYLQIRKKMRDYMHNDSKTFYTDPDYLSRFDSEKYNSDELKKTLSKHIDKDTEDTRLGLYSSANSNEGGVYYLDNGEIGINTNANYNNMNIRNTLFHEYSHRLHFADFNDDLKKIATMIDLQNKPIFDDIKNHYKIDVNNPDLYEKKYIDYISKPTEFRSHLLEVVRRGFNTGKRTPEEMYEIAKLIKPAFTYAFDKDFLLKALASLVATTPIVVSNNN